MGTAINSHKDLIVWQKAMDLVVAVYTLTECFPKSEQYGLVSQMRRAAVSIPSNIAEGYRRGTKKDYRNFLIISLGSGSELDTQIDIAMRVRLTTQQQSAEVITLLVEVLKMLNCMVHTLDERSTPYTLHPTP